MNTKIRLTVYLLILVAIVAIACTANMTMKPWSEQTSKERLIWAISIYNAQDRDYRTMSQMTNLTPDQKSVLAKKKAIMLRLYPLLDAYRLTIESGGVPSIESEQMILNMLNELQTLMVMP